MTGKELKTFLTALDSSLANVARKLNITSQGLESLFRTKDVKTGTIEKISKLYDKPISYFFNEDPQLNIEANADHNSGASISGPVVVLNDNCPKDESSKIEELENTIDDLNNQIEVANADNGKKDKMIKDLEHKIELQEQIIESKQNDINRLENTISKMDDTIAILKNVVTK